MSDNKKDSNNKANKKSYTAMPADEYQEICALCWPNQSEPKTAKALGITLATHRLWLAQGINGDYQPTKADKNRARVMQAVKARQEQVEMQSAQIVSWLLDNGQD